MCGEIGPHTFTLILTSSIYSETLPSQLQPSTENKHDGV